MFFYFLSFTFTYHICVVITQSPLVNLFCESKKEVACGEKFHKSVQNLINMMDALSVGFLRCNNSAPLANMCCESKKGVAFGEKSFKSIQIFQNNAPSVGFLRCNYSGPPSKHVLRIKKSRLRREIIQIYPNFSNLFSISDLICTEQD